MDENGNDTFSEIEAAVREEINRLARRVFLGMVAIGIGGGWYVGTGNLRPDPFLGSDGVELEEKLIRSYKTDLAFMQQELLIEIKSVQVECQRQIQKVEDTKPPGLTRQRIIACENCCRRVDPQYKQPTWEWN